jgi:CBS domain-containing protein
MSSPVIAVRLGTTLVGALKVLRAADIRHLVVVDDADRCRGLLTDRVIVAARAMDQANFAARTVADVLGPVVPAVMITATVADAAEDEPGRARPVLAAGSLGGADGVTSPVPAARS